MPPIRKESGTLTATPETTERTGSATAPVDAAVKQQAVALDVPVTVNGLRTAEGSDKREPFSESTKTVMVFGSGAIIRLSFAMAPGQLIFLTNERTKREIVCQVVKSKNYRNMSGYVELEFTEPAVGYWGMRFPGDRASSGTQSAPTAVRPSASNGSRTPAAPVAPKIAQPGASSADSVAAKPAAPVPPPAKPVTPATPVPCIAPAPLDSASLLGAAKPKAKDSAAPAASLASEEKLVEPWLKKPQPVSPARPASPVAAAPETPANSSTVDAELAVTPTFELARASDKAASIFAPSEPASNLSGVDLSSITPFFEVKPASGDATPVAPVIPVTEDAETEELKQHTARLQEQLSSMQFAEPASSPAAEPEPGKPLITPGEHATPLLKTDPVHESAVQLVENAGASKVGASLPEPIEPEKIAPIPPARSLESLEQEELKIPAWLEPLARNTAAPTSTQELVLREKAKRVAEQPKLEEITADLAAPVEPEPIVEARVPQFGSVLPFEEAQSARESPSKKRGKGVPFGAIAAGVGLVLLTAGGWWYTNQRSAGVQASVPVTQAEVATPEAGVQTKEQAAAASPTGLSAPPDSAASQPSQPKANLPAHANAANFSGSSEAGSAAIPAHNTEVSSKNPSSGALVSKPSSGSTGPAPAVVEVKKPTLGDVHLAAPKIAKNRHAQSGAEADAGLELNEAAPENDAASLNSSLEIASKQPAAPAAPAAVGGNVKPAKLISSVPPVYPAMARAQHIAGNVMIDALIDANGRVTSMKVISGAVLLQQAAMDALRQWKYRPANLDGKAVSMHLTVTIQFRLE